VLIRAPGRGGIFVICVSDSIRGMIPGHSTHVSCRLDRALRTGVKGDQATNPRREAVGSNLYYEPAESDVATTTRSRWTGQYRRLRRKGAGDPLSKE
jgi:hypothetical protein